MIDTNTGVPAEPLTDEQLERLLKMGNPVGAFGEELYYLPRAVKELKTLRELVRLIYAKANVGLTIDDDTGFADLEHALMDIAMQIRTTPGFLPGKAR